MRYNGTEIIREYKGFEITRKKKYYFGKAETHYAITKVPSGILTDVEEMTLTRVFDTLKNAKQYIDGYFRR